MISLDVLMWVFLASYVIHIVDEWVILALIWPFGFALHGLTVHLPLLGDPHLALDRVNPPR